LQTRSYIDNRPFVLQDGVPVSKRYHQAPFHRINSLHLLKVGHSSFHALVQSVSKFHCRMPLNFHCQADSRRQDKIRVHDIHKSVSKFHWSGMMAQFLSETAATKNSLESRRPLFELHPRPHSYLLK